MGLLCAAVSVLALLYGALVTRELYELFHPPACRGSACLRPLLEPSTPLELRGYAVSPAAADGAEWRTLVWNVSHAQLDKGEIEAKFELPVPAAVRLGQQHQFELLIELRKAGDPLLLATARTALVRAYKPKTRGAVEYLLEPLLGSDGDALPDGTAEAAEGPAGGSGLSLSKDEDGMVRDARGRVAHFVYASSRVEIRLVSDVTPHTSPYLPEGLPVGSSVDVRMGVYAPLFYIEEFSLLRKHALPLSSSTTKTNPQIRLRMRSISIGRHRLMAMAHVLLSKAQVAADQFDLQDEIDEVRELMSEERIYRFVLMQIIGFLHIVFDLLAFKSDVGFWKGRETMRGLSSRAVLSSAAQTIIVYLYLLDADGVNSIVLATYTASAALELWKTAQVLRIMREQRVRPSPEAPATQIASMPIGAPSSDDRAVGYCDSTTKGLPEASPRAQPTTLHAPGKPSDEILEAATEHFDEIATHTLGVGLGPLVAGWAIFCLVYYPHTTWYSWLISSLADSVYLFGFIGMTPQLFINYKLKSVAHMPWRVMAYKAFNTFVRKLARGRLGIALLCGPSCMAESCERKGRSPHAGLRNMNCLPKWLGISCFGSSDAISPAAWILLVFSLATTCFCRWMTPSR